jgi:DMSO reductase anchor subunit
MLYDVTRRAWWQARRTAPLFVLSAASTGLLATMTTTAVLAVVDRGFAERSVAQVRILGFVVAAVTALKLLTELAAFRYLRDAELTDRRRSALLLRRDLWLPVQVRVFLGAVGGVVLPIVLASGASASTVPAVAIGCVAAALLLVGGELLERHHFFRVAVAPRMPGELH